VSGRCDVCGKEPSFGHRVARLGKSAQKRRIQGRSKRMFRPNIQTVHAMVNGTSKRLNACTSCIKKGKIQQRVHI
jgi:large subunit ribosomal protein L28